MQCEIGVCVLTIVAEIAGSLLKLSFFQIVVIPSFTRVKSHYNEVPCFMSRMSHESKLFFNRIGYYILNHRLPVFKLA